MEIVFWITFLLSCLVGIYTVLIKKEYFSIYIFLLIGVYIPLFMYMLNWSELIYPEISNNFYLIFIYINICVIISSFLYKGKFYVQDIKYKVKNDKIFVLINIIFFLLIFIENYMGSGEIFPALNNIDIHTYAAPLISFITGNSYCLMVGNVLFFMSTKKKRYILFIILQILIPIITKGARMQVLVSIVQTGCFILFYIYLRNKKVNFKINKRFGVIILLCIILLMNLMVKYTDYRMNHFGKYDLKYEDTIKYTGPEFFKKPLSIYYGYFPLSFNNLNINMILKDNDRNYVGLYSFKSLYYGIFQLDNFLNIDPFEPENNSLVTSSSATVPTGFYDYYYDFGELSIIPIIIAIAIYCGIYRKLRTAKKILWAMVYFYYIPLWIFMSFQNTIYGTAVPWGFVLIVLIYKLFIKDIKEEY